jgi:superfamily I DNA/RNA helicase
MYVKTEEQIQCVNSALQAANFSTPLIIEAGAGCGKTTTLHSISSALFEAGHAKQLYLAYNSALAAAGREAFPSGVEVRTVHSVAYRALSKALAHRKTGSVYSKHIIDALALEGRSGVPDKFAYARALLTSMERFCASDDKNICLEHIAQWLLHDTISLEQAIDDTQRLFQLVSPLSKGSIPVTHDAYLKTWHLLGAPGMNEYDSVLVDEAQDSSAVMLGCLEHANNLIAVGDSAQQIYAFRGAVDALTNMDGLRCSLSQSFRFGPEVAILANKLLQKKKVKPGLVLKGNADNGTSLTAAPKCEAVTKIYRTNAELVKDALMLYDYNLSDKVFVIGDLEDLAFKVRTAFDLKRGEHSGKKHPSFFQFKSFFEAECWAEKYADAEIAQIISMTKEFESRSGDVVGMLENLGARTKAHKKPPKDARFVLTTAHRCKGLEWPNTIIASDFDRLLTSFNQKRLGSKLDDELNLLYVALTRGIQTVDIRSSYLLDIAET